MRRALKRPPSEEKKRYKRSNVLPETPTIFGPYKTKQQPNAEIEAAAVAKRQRRLARNLRNAARQ